MDTKQRNLYEIAAVSFKLGCIGFGGIAGMVSLIENEIVTKRRWISPEHYMDVVGAANIVPGPNSVEIIMHCAHYRGGKPGLIWGGLSYILPATLLCLLWACLYSRYGHLPSVQPFIVGIRPAVTAIIIATVFRLSKTAFKTVPIIVISSLVLVGSLLGMNEVILLFAAGILGTLYLNGKRFYSLFPFPLIFVNNPGKLFFIFLKIGAILYGSGYVLFAYLDDALVQRNHWLTKQQLTDAIAIGQITPGPILSSATFAGYLINGTTGALLATIGIFLPSFFIAFFLHRFLSFIDRHSMLRTFLNIVNGASVALIAAVGIHMLSIAVTEWKSAVILLLCLSAILLVQKMNTVWLIFFGSIAGYCLSLI
jgi:chromate transporter